MNYNTILVLMFLGIILFIVIKILIGPLKILLKLLYSCTLGTFGLFIFNAVGSLIGLHIGLNFLTVVIVGILGLPGLTLLLLLQTVFKV